MYLTPEGELLLGDDSERPSTGDWLNRDVPKDGWAWDDCENTGSYPGPTLCEMCRHERPQYLHHVHHPEDRPRVVGGVCAAWMTQDPRGVIVERIMRNAAAREEAWLRDAGDWVDLWGDKRRSHVIHKITRLRRNASRRLKAVRKDAAAFPGRIDVERHEQLLQWLRKDERELKLRRRRDWDWRW